MFDETKFIAAVMKEAANTPRFQWDMSQSEHGWQWADDAMDELMHKVGYEQGFSQEDGWDEWWNKYEEEGENPCRTALMDMYEPLYTRYGVRTYDIEKEDMFLDLSDEMVEEIAKLHLDKKGITVLQLMLKDSDGISYWVSRNQIRNS